MGGGERITIVAIVSLYWIIALAVWWVSLWHIHSYIGFGSDLPQLTQMAGQIAEAGGWFILAAICSGIALYKSWGIEHGIPLMPIWLLGILTTLALMAMVAVTLPIVNLCDQFVPQRTLNKANGAEEHNGAPDPHLGSTRC